MTKATRTTGAGFIVLRDFLDTQPWLSPAHGADNDAMSCIACAGTARTSLSASDGCVLFPVRIVGLATFFVNSVMPVPLAVDEPPEADLQTTFPAVLALLGDHTIRLFLRSHTPWSLSTCENIVIPASNENPLCFTIILPRLHAEPEITIAESPAADASASLVLRAPFITLVLEFPADAAPRVRAIRDAMVDGSLLSTAPPPLSAWELTLANTQSDRAVQNGLSVGNDDCNVKNVDVRHLSLQSTLDTFINTAAGFVMPSPFPYPPISSPSETCLGHNKLLRATICVERAIRAARCESDAWVRFAEEGPTATSNDEMPPLQHVAERREETQRNRVRIESISLNAPCKKQ